MRSQHQIETLVPMAVLLPMIILTEGFVSIAIEILAIRQLLPVVGSSIIVTSLIIGIFLLFLAIGYGRGGRVEFQLTEQLQRNFFVTAVWAGIGLSYLFIHYFFMMTDKMTGTHTLYSLTFYLLVILAPIVYFLGQTLPITMNLVRQTHSAGVIAGRALALSTIGSFLGSILSTLVLMHYFGVAITIFIVFICLVVMSFLLTTRLDVNIAHFVIASFVTLAVFYCNVIFERHYFVLSDAYANYQILDKTNSNLIGRRILVVNESASSSVDDSNAAFPYVEQIKKIILDDLKLTHANILVLGAGGFTISQTQNSNFGNRYTYVDVDDQLKKIVVPKFIKKMDARLVIDDARHFVNVTKNYYDVIVLDVYTNRISIPAHLLTLQFFNAVKSRLAKHGVAIFNIIADPYFNDDYSRRIDNTIRAIFPNCTVTPIVYSDAFNNLIYVCSVEIKRDNTIYVDDKNNATIDAFSVR